MTLAISGKKIGGWIFNKWPGIPVVGPMRCNTCGKRLNGEPITYCYRHSAELCTNEFQCPDCGKDEPHWVQLQAEIDAHERARREDMSRTNHTVILQRIRNAFEEGFSAGATSDTMVEEADEWETSEAKEIHDILAKLWGINEKS